MFAVTMECLESRWFPDVQAVAREAGIATLLDLGLFPQRRDTGRRLPEGYRFVFNGLTADEKRRVRVASADRRPRPLPWAFVCLLTPERARLADALTREVSAGGFLYMPTNTEAAVPGNFLNEAELEHVLRRSPYAIWCGQDEHFYMESQRFRQAVLAGAAPVKVLFGERPPAGAPFASALVPFDGLTERLAQTPAADLHRRAADEFCALPRLEESLAELLGLPMPEEEESDAYSR
jgi:hypothetical protein